MKEKELGKGVKSIFVRLSSLGDLARMSASFAGPSCAYIVKSAGKWVAHCIGE
jgi:hypothetical protein